MKILSTIILTLLLTVSCKSITGDVEVLETISLVKKGKWTDIEPGIYNAKMRIKSKRKLKIKIDGKTYTFRTPKGITLPRENGELTLTSDQSGQPYDLDMKVNTVRENADVQESNEFCTYAIPYTVCQTTGPYGGTVCSTRFRNYPGTRYSKWFMQSVEQNLSLALLSEDSDAKLATFKAYDKYTKKIYEHQGLCR